MGKKRKASKKKRAACAKGRPTDTAPIRKSSRRLKAWYVARFRERYELAEDVRFDRKSPLLYTKSFVGSGTDDESCGFFRQLMALRSKSNWLELRGAFAELKGIAGNQGQMYRGYLLDGNFKPALTKEIGRWLNIDEQAAAQILAELEDVGLLERVTLPKFDVGGSGKAGGGKAKKSRGRKAAARKKRTTTKVATVAPERARARTCQPERAREPLKNNGNANGKGKATNGKTTAVGSKAKKDGNGKEESGKSKVLQAHGREQRQCRRERRTAALRSTARPLPPEPQESRTGGSGNVIPFAGPPCDYSRSGLGYGRRVYLALGYPWDIDSPEAAREICSFASKHDKVGRVLSGLPPPAFDGVLARGLREAAKIAKRKANRNCGAVWNSLMDRLANARQREAM